MLNQNWSHQPTLAGREILESLIGYFGAACIGSVQLKLVILYDFNKCIKISQHTFIEECPIINNLIIPRTKFHSEIFYGFNVMDQTRLVADRHTDRHLTEEKKQVVSPEGGSTINPVQFK